MARLIVTGASGLLGVNLVLEASSKHEVIAITNQHRMGFKHIREETIDLTVEGEVKRLFDHLRPDAVINCAAGTAIDKLETDPQLAMRLNCEMAGHLARAAKMQGARFIQFSTDAVFNGMEGNYSEIDRPDPVNQYGRSKLAGEELVLQEDPDALVIRTNIFGWSPGWKDTLAEWFVGQLESGRTVPGFMDTYFSPIFVNDLARITLELINHSMNNIVHIPGADCVSKYEFGVRIARALSLNPDQVQATPSASADFTAPRPRNTCLCGDRIRELVGIELPALNDGIRRLFELRDQGYLEQIRIA